LGQGRAGVLHRSREWTHPCSREWTQGRVRREIVGGSSPTSTGGRYVARPTTPLVAFSMATRIGSPILDPQGSAGPLLQRMPPAGAAEAGTASLSLAPGVTPPTSWGPPPGASHDSHVVPGSRQRCHPACHAWLDSLPLGTQRNRPPRPPRGCWRCSASSRVGLVPRSEGSAASPLTKPARRHGWPLRRRWAYAPFPFDCATEEVRRCAPSAGGDPLPRDNSEQLFRVPHQRSVPGVYVRPV